MNVTIWIMYMKFYTCFLSGFCLGRCSCRSNSHWSRDSIISWSNFKVYDNLFWLAIQCYSSLLGRGVSALHSLSSNWYTVYKRFKTGQFLLNTVKCHSAPHFFCIIGTSLPFFRSCVTFNKYIVKWLLNRD